MAAYHMTKAKKGSDHRPLSFLEEQAEHLNNLLKRRGGKHYTGPQKKSHKKKG